MLFIPSPVPESLNRDLRRNIMATWLPSLRDGSGRNSCFENGLAMEN